MIKLKRFRTRCLLPMCLFLIALALFTNDVLAQSRKISGVVTSQTTGETLPGVSIVIKGTTTGTVTNIDGTYSIDVPNDQSILVFSFVGMATQEEVVGARTVVDLGMADDIQALAEVVVVGYGEQQKSLVTGSISSLDAKEIKTVSAGNVLGAIQGRTAGIQVAPTSGSPGAGFVVKVRGTGSNGNSQPLYIVDGMRTDNIDFLEQGEMQSMEILKDAASSAIYGAEGANGVVIITTRNGGKGNEGLTYDFQYGVQQANTNLELMNAQQHAEYMEEAGIGGRTVADVAGVQTTDWLDAIFETAPLQRHSLSFAGSNDKSNYYVRGSYFTQDGIVGGDKSSFERFNARFNLNTELETWLDVGVRMSYTRTNRRVIAEDSEFGGILSNVFLMDPATPQVYTGALPDFVQALVDNGSPLIRNEAGQIYGLSNFVTGEIYNPLGGLDIVKGRGLDQDRLFGSLFANIKPTDDLTLTSRVGVDASSGYFHGWTPSFYFTDTRQSNSANVQQSGFRTTRWMWENYATYDKEINDHKFSLLAGTSVWSQRTNFVNAAGTGLSVENDLFGFVGAVPIENTTGSGGEELRTLSSYFARLSYDYDGKYLFNATIRRDGSSMLADGNQWGSFPSVSLGWVLSNEDFYSSSVVNFIKLRGSWGTNGSLAGLSPGRWRSAITFNNQYPDATGNLLIAAEPGVLSNPELTWETSKQLDIGIDLGFFDDEFTLTMDYFNKTTEDLLTPGVIPDFAGNNAPTVNLGDVRNRGFEFEVKWRKNTGDLDYTISANATILDNEVTRLDENLDFAPGVGVGTGWTATAFEEGRPAWYFRGYKTDGIFQNQSEVDAYTANIGGITPVPGDPRVLDVNGDGVITPDDQTFIGSPQADAIFGARADVKYKNWDFVLFLQGTIGNDILLGYYRTDRQTSNKPSFFYEDRWTESNPTNDWFRADGSNIYAYNSDFMIFDGSFMRIKQIQVGYNLPSTMLDRWRIGSARLYVSLEDFFTFTSYPGLDPESTSNNVAGTGIDRGYYPLAKKFVTGLTINF